MRTVWSEKLTRYAATVWGIASVQRSRVGRTTNMSLYRFVNLTFDILYSKIYNEEREYIQQTIMATNEFVLASYFNPRNLYTVRHKILECGPMANVMVALPNTGGALCSTPQSLADAHY